jgi:hypothetical protein
VLRLELPLLDRPGRFPVENEGRRGEEDSTGDGEAGGGEGADEPPRSIAGISVSGALARYVARRRHGTYRFRLHPVQHCSVRRGSSAPLFSSGYPSAAPLA